ncbi:hypothetical protein [Paenibacillus sp. FSL K6-2524]|uniref:hypothetical protein n=1 Tax=Paenibacillus sp. FSL K6-2524 TaxID=2954516 RepID=UPI0030FAD827
MSKSDALLKSVSLRESHIDRANVLEKVKKLILLPGDMNASIEQVSEYYGVTRKTIDSLIFDNRDELESDGLRVLTGDELFSFKEMAIISKMARSFTVIPRRAILRIGMLLRDSVVARAVRVNLLNTEEASSQQPIIESELLHFKKEAYMVEVAANVLRLPESGRLKLLGDFIKQHGLALPLPGYADEPITESATELLKKHGVGIQTKAFNMLLLNRRILEEKERPSSRSGTKTYKSLTDTGLEYEKNIISPNNPRETAPHYYPNRFPELLDLVGLTERVAT